MTGAKTNERPGTRAQVRHSGVSAYKARAVLDEIRGLSVIDAADVLALSERGVSEVISGCLDSAVANAEHNDLQIAEELYVSTCYADEGPTAKRWRPRARGRATPIRKRSCHITIIVSRFDDEAIERRQAKEERARASTGGRATKADRAARVAKSKKVDKGDEAEDVESEVGDDVETEEAASVEPAAAEATFAGLEEPSDVEDTAASTTAAGLEEPSDAENTAEPSAFGEDSHAPLADDSMPEGFPVKGNADSMKYHQPGGRWYDSTVAEVWFASAEAAEAAGFVEAGSKQTESGEDE